MIQPQVGNTLHLVPVDQVADFEAADKYVRMVMAEREHPIRVHLDHAARHDLPREAVAVLDPAAGHLGAAVDAERRPEAIDLGLIHAVDAERQRLAELELRPAIQRLERLPEQFELESPPKASVKTSRR